MHSVVYSTHVGKHTLTYYLIRRWYDGIYSWEYKHKEHLDVISKDNFSTYNEVLKDLHNMEHLLSLSMSVLI